MNGFEVLRELRRRGSTAGVIMLTAKGLEEDKVLGLDLGADDYVQEPFGGADDGKSSGWCSCVRRMAMFSFCKAYQVRQRDLQETARE